MLNRRVLVVEDDVGAQALISAALHRLNPEILVQCVSSAEHAFRLVLENNADHTPYDLIVTDVMLPDSSDGLELWKACLNRYPWMETDFLVVSGITWHEFLRKTADTEGSPYFMEKPLSPEALQSFFKDKFYATIFSG